MLLIGDVFFLIQAGAANVPVVRRCGRVWMGDCAYFYIINILACLSPLKTEE